MKIFWKWLIFLIIPLFICSLLWADVTDIVKFDRQTKLILQKNPFFYDATKSHGVYSPLTDYIGSLVKALEDKSSFQEAMGFAFPELESGEVLVEYVDAKKKTKLDEKVDRKNYLGVQSFFVVPAGIETVFELLTDYDNLEKLFPGLQKSFSVEKWSNRQDVENIRETNIPILGGRSKYYRMTNIFSLKNNSHFKIIKSQLLSQVERDKAGKEIEPKDQPALGAHFSDSLWYLEQAGDNLTKVYNLAFSLMRWDYEKAPPIFPYIHVKIRRGMVKGYVEGAFKNAKAIVLKLGEESFKKKKLSEFTKEDKENLEEAIEKFLKKARKKRHIKINWKEAF